MPVCHEDEQDAAGGGHAAHGTACSRTAKLSHHEGAHSRAAGISMVVPAPRRRADVWDTTPEEAALVEEVSAPARGITSLAWLRPFASLLQLDLRHNRLCCLDGIWRVSRVRP